MPDLGDFFRIRTPAGFVRVWDPWLQQVLADGRAAFGAQWAALYLSAPIWRFTLAAGIAGPRPVMGVLMPSVDRVGRMFPLTLMAPVDGAPVELHAAAGPAFEQIEEIALSTLEDGMTRGMLENALSRAGAPSGPPDAVLLSLATRAAAAPSVWSTMYQDVPRAYLFDGLPRGRGATVFFNPDDPAGGDTA